MFRHYSVPLKFLITVIAALILLGFTQTLPLVGELAANRTLSMDELRSLNQSPMLHSAAGLLVLLVTTILAIYKPWGVTPYGLRKRSDRASTTTTPWGLYALPGVTGLMLLFLVLHLMGGGPRHD